MATKPGIIDYLLDQIGRTQSVTARKMFGEYGVYSQGKLVALVCDDQLFVKPTPKGRAFIGEASVVEGSPYPGAKPYLQIEGDLWDDFEWLGELIGIVAAELPTPAPRALKASAASAKAKPPALSVKQTPVKQTPVKQTPVASAKKPSASAKKASLRVSTPRKTKQG